MHTPPSFHGSHGFLSEMNYSGLTTPEAFWTSMFPLLEACSSVFPRNLPKDLLDSDDEMFVILIFDNFINIVNEIVAYGWLYSQ